MRQERGVALRRRLHPVIASAYAAKVIGKAAIGRYLQTPHPELLTELSTIVSAASIDQADAV